MKLNELKVILERRPSIVRSFVAMKAVKLIAFLMMWLSWILVGYFTFIWIWDLDLIQVFDSKELQAYKLKYKNAVVFLLLTYLLLAGVLAYVRSLNNMHRFIVGRGLRTIVDFLDTRMSILVSWL